jgi:hypothetical protein
MKLLRNFSELVPAGAPYAGLPIASGQWQGLLGSEIAASAGTGEHGAGLLANDSLTADAEYRLVVRNSTFAAGALAVEEDGAVEYLGAGTAVYDLYEANLLVGTATFSGGYGAVQATFNGQLDGLAGDLSAGSPVQASFAGLLESVTGQVTVLSPPQAVMHGELNAIDGGLSVGTFIFSAPRQNIVFRPALRTIGAQEIA